MSKRKKGVDARLADVSVAPRERWQHAAEYDVVEIDKGDVLTRHVQRVVVPSTGCRNRAGCPAPR